MSAGTAGPPTLLCVHSAGPTADRVAGGHALPSTLGQPLPSSEAFTGGGHQQRRHRDPPSQVLSGSHHSLHLHVPSQHLLPFLCFPPPPHISLPLRLLSVHLLTLSMSSLPSPLSLQALVLSKGTQQLVPRKALQSLRPKWHPPWKLMRVISGHLGWVRCIAVDPSNEWFATGSGDRTIKVQAPDESA